MIYSYSGFIKDGECIQDYFSIKNKQILDLNSMALHFNSTNITSISYLVLHFFVSFVRRKQNERKGDIGFNFEEMFIENYPSEDVL